MSTHNICFYGELTKIILQLSSNTLLICSSAYLSTFLLFHGGGSVKMMIFNGYFKQSCTCFKSYDNFHGGDCWKCCMN